MAEYIEREALLARVKEKSDLFDKKIEPFSAGLYKYLAGEVEAMPAADVVEVVRCKDCKHLGRSVRLFAGDSPADAAACTLFRGQLRTLNEFCSCGERRADNGN